MSHAAIESGRFLKSHSAWVVVAACRSDLSNFLSGSLLQYLLVWRNEANRPIWAARHHQGNSALSLVWVFVDPVGGALSNEWSSPSIIKVSEVEMPSYLIA